MAARSGPDLKQKRVPPDLESKIKAVITAENDAIRLHSFWSKYSIHHRLKSNNIPTPKEYGFKQRSDILRNCSGCRITKRPDGFEYVELKGTGKRENKEERKNTKTCERESRTGKKKQAGKSEANAKASQELKTQLFKFSDKSDTQTDAKMSGRSHPWQYGASGGWAGPQGSNFYQQQGQMFYPNPPEQHYNRGFQGHHTFNYNHQAGSSRSQNKPVKHIPKDQINAVAQDCIDRLVEAKEYVSIERIEKLILDYYKVESLQEIGIRHLEHVKCINEHVRTQVRVNGYIQGFIRIRAIATLYELHENLREYAPDKQGFETLKLGPLVKQPMVYEYFKFPSDAEIMGIETKDVLDHLRQYLSDENLWMERIEMDGFMKHVASIYNVDTPFALGLRIKSMPLVVGVSNTHN